MFPSFFTLERTLRLRQVTLEEPTSERRVLFWRWHGFAMLLHKAEFRHDETQPSEK
jgi:hypothetical protein